jgi:CHRD domain
MLNKFLKICMFVSLIALLPAVAHGQEGRRFGARLVGYEEVPALSNSAEGTFNMLIDPSETSFDFELTYSGVSGTGATQSHIHIAQKGVNGGVMVFFCTNLGNGPAGTPPCPANGTVTGTITAADVIGPAGQGVSAGEFAEVLKAIRSGVVYANVHSVLFAGGEIRGQLSAGAKPQR